MVNDVLEFVGNNWFWFLLFWGPFSTISIKAVRKVERTFENLTEREKKLNNECRNIKKELSDRESMLNELYKQVQSQKLVDNAIWMTMASGVMPNPARALYEHAFFNNDDHTQYVFDPENLYPRQTGTMGKEDDGGRVSMDDIFAENTNQLKEGNVGFKTLRKWNASN